MLVLVVPRGGPGGERRRYPGEIGETGNLKGRRVRGVRRPILLRAKGRDRDHLGPRAIVDSVAQFSMPSGFLQVL